MKQTMKHYVNCDGKFLYNQLYTFTLRTGYGKEALSKQLGYSKSYLAGVIRNGRACEEDLRILCIKTCIDFDRLTSQHVPYSPSGLQPREHIQRQTEKVKAYIKTPTQPDVKQMLNEVTKKQTEINELLVKIWGRVNNV